LGTNSDDPAPADAQTTAYPDRLDSGGTSMRAYSDRLDTGDTSTRAYSDQLDTGDTSTRAYSDQLDSGGASMREIVQAALDAAQPAVGLRWLDIGCGRGDLLREIRDRWQPAALRGVDPIDWLEDDLRADVEFHTLPAEHADRLAPADRVLLVETIEHLEAPWSALRAAARLVAPGGRIVVSTPNLATLRTRLELAVRGNLTSFRPGYQPHLTPALPHVTSRILAEENLTVEDPRFAGADVISLAKGRVWPERVRQRRPALTSISVVIAARRDGVSNAA
jgi:2-polyprenyl-3-methyl-5-hydroxy-6-metoxy-1,4-benzoquinol methylase